MNNICLLDVKKIIMLRVTCTYISLPYKKINVCQLIQYDTIHHKLNDYTI